MQIGVAPDARVAALADALGVDAEKLPISLELEFVGDGISGRASVGAAAGTTFGGWLGLLGTIDALVAEAGAATTYTRALKAAPGRGDPKQTVTHRRDPMTHSAGGDRFNTAAAPGPDRMASASF